MGRRPRTVSRLFLSSQDRPPVARALAPTRSIFGSASGSYASNFASGRAAAETVDASLPLTHRLPRTSGLTLVPCSGNDVAARRPAAISTAFPASASPLRQRPPLQAPIAQA